MQQYREPWNYIFFGNDGIGPTATDRYWLTVAIPALVFFLFGTAAIRVRLLPIAVTWLFVALYVVAVVPFILWAASCSDCRGSFSFPTERARELILIQQSWGVVLTTTLASFWTGAVAALSVRCAVARLRRTPLEDGQAAD